MITKRTVNPTTEPVSLAEAKLHLRVDTTDEDALISGLIQTAREYCERYQRRSYLTQTWRAALDAFPASDTDFVALPYAAPLASVTSVQYLDNNGATQTLSASLYTVDTYHEPGGIYLNYSQSWPVTREIARAITITYVAGETAASSVPATVKQAMLLLIGHWYANREAVLTGSTSTEIGFAVESLLWPDRLLEV